MISLRVILNCFHMRMFCSSFNTLDQWIACYYVCRTHGKFSQFSVIIYYQLQDFKLLLSNKFFQR